MRFGDIPLDEAVGALLAHSIRHGRLVFKKGRRLSAADVAALREAGIATVTAAVLDPGDLHEDEAARRIAEALRGDGLSAGAPFTGRVNLYAEAHGLAVLDIGQVDAVNRVHEAITVATLPSFDVVAPKQMVATIKIIPFTAPADAVARIETLVGGHPPIRVAPFRGRRVGLIQTELASVKPSVLDKTVQTTAERLAQLDCMLLPERRCPHDAAALAETIPAALADGAELLLIAGASAITDRRDVLPAGIEAAGGAVEHFGMPVDPGQLLLLGRIGQVPVLGLPGCARSPKLNGFDWVLQRLAADLPVGPADIMGMGVGGLLAEIPSRPLPRAGAAAQPVPAKPRLPRIAAIVLAAGQSRRMGPDNKLLREIDGGFMVSRVVDAALASHADPVIVVTGHQRDRVEAALAGRAVRLVHNPAYAEGLSTSLRAGLAAVPADSDGALVCLGDMPRVRPAQLDRLIAAYNPVEGRAIVVPTRLGKRGNPVLWDRRFFAEMADVAGDVGARHLIGEHADVVVEVEMENESVLLDIDTPEALEHALRTVPQA